MIRLLKDYKYFICLAIVSFFLGKLSNMVSLFTTILLVSALIFFIFLKSFKNT